MDGSSVDDEEREGSLLWGKGDSVESDKSDNVLGAIASAGDFI